jgi:signal transduction histidine kinase/ligand-binding sensor domain-containing protein
VEEWGSEQGLNCGAVHSLAQTPDGYLWIGGEAGLVRFDGINFQLMSGKEANGLPAGPIQQLVTDSDGNLWVRERDMSLLRYRRENVQNILRTVLHLDEGATAMCMGRPGGVIFWARSDGVWCWKRGSVQALYRNSTTRPNLLVISLAETPDHTLWLGSRDSGLLALQNGKLVDHSAKLPDLKVNAILTNADGQLWIGTDGGAIRWDGSQETQAGVPKELQKTQVISLARDHEANIWAGTENALYRVTATGDVTAVRSDRFVGVRTILEDREGNLWLGTEDGLARLRDSPFLSYPLSNDRSVGRENSPIYVDGGGRTWYSTRGGRVDWRQGQQTGEIRVGKSDDTIYSISGWGADVWVGRKLGGLAHIQCKETCRLVRNYTEADGLGQNSVTCVLAVADGSVWAGTVNAGVSKLQEDRFTTFTSASGLASNSVNAITQTGDGTFWFATTEGLSTEHNGTWRTYYPSDGLPPGGVNCLKVDSQGVLWIGTSEGLAYFQSGKIHTAQWGSGPGEQIFGLAAANSESLWIATPTHILQVRRSAALAGHIGSADVQTFGPADGVLTGSILRRSPTVASDSLGRIWFSTTRGLSVVDPRRLPAQWVPALPHVQAISADAVDLTFSDRVEVPALRKRVVFRFVGLSLTVPQRVQYQYRLDNFDLDWSNPVSTRDAVYTNLPPGNYRFRVRASNAAGRWSSEESSVLVRVQPAFWQTLWFETAGGLVVGLGFVVAYRRRLHAVRHALNLRFQERLSERTRIAQELHDTLLQGFLSASMQLHVASNRLEENSPAKAPLQRATELMRKASDEGRVALRQLRSEDTTSLECAFATIPHEAMIDDDVGFRLRMEGHTRPLRPVVRDDIYRICREAIVNAIRHSDAKDIEVEICYHPHQLRVTVQDDGRGIDLEVMRSGRDGHWGIKGMRERAERIKAKLSILSSPGAGTEVVLRVPGNLAYESKGRKTAASWLTSLRSKLKCLVRGSGPTEEHG